MTPEQYAALDEKIDRLMRQVAAPTPPPVAPVMKPVSQIWGYADIAKWIGKNERAVRDITRLPSFPKPIDCAIKDPRWFADEVEKWARTHRAKD